MPKKREPVVKNVEVKEVETKEEVCDNPNCLTVMLDDSELEMIRKYTDMWNEARKHNKEYKPITLEQFMFIGAFKWCQYIEAQLSISLLKMDNAFEVKIAGDPLDDDPEFVEAFTQSRGIS